MLHVRAAAALFSCWMCHIILPANVVVGQRRGDSFGSTPEGNR
jgi:hypothetical protein